MGLAASGSPRTPLGGVAFAAPSAPLRVARGALPRGEGARRAAQPAPRDGAASRSCQFTVAAAAAAVSAAAGAATSRRRGRTARQAKKKGGFGPVPYEQQAAKAAVMDEVGERVQYMVDDNAKGLCDQLKNYGYAQVDGFLANEIHGYPNRIRDEMKAMFDRGWFEEETESEGSFKIGEYRITNQDQAHRFRVKLLGSTDAEGVKRVETQYEVAPTVISFVRSLLVSVASSMGKAGGGALSTNVGSAELNVFCGNGARRDRRVSNEFGWNTERGFAPDPRKLTVMYFANPQAKAEHGGHLQLEGVITPSGAVSIAPTHDRLVMFWADKTVWSMRPSQANLISEHQMCIVMQLMAEKQDSIEYDPRVLARWFPELRDKPMSLPSFQPMPGMPQL